MITCAQQGTDGWGVQHNTRRTGQALPVRKVPRHALLAVAMKRGLVQRITSKKG